jgi:hypothetical protein
MNDFSKPLMSRNDHFDKTLRPENYEFLCRSLKAYSGLNLTDNKQYLIETRL